MQNLLKTAVLLLLTSLLLILGTTGTLQAQECTTRPLNILLTNDDGYSTPGIAALHHALRDAGHNVKRIAPARNFSGSSASLTLAAITAKPIADEELTIYAVEGSPATTVLLGASVFFSADEPLDLVVSGINEGANLGPAANFSGTVGATTAGLRALVPAVPGIAVSTNPVNDDARSPENLELSKQIAGFISRLVAHLQTVDCAAGTVLPGGVALNINYPPGAKGIRLARQGLAPFFTIRFSAIGEDRYAPQFGEPPAGSSDVANADTVLFNEGFVTIVPINGDYTADSTVTEVLAGVAALAP